MLWRIKNIEEFSVTELARCLSLATPERRLQLQAIHHDRRRVASLCAEWLAKAMLAEACRLPIEKILLARTEKGKPYAEGLPYHFNVSHSGNLIACAIAKVPIGIDIEEFRSLDLKIARRACTPEEQAFIAPGTEGDLRRFFSIWTAKEAYFKCIGSGITDLKRIRFDHLRPRLQQLQNEEYTLSIYQQ